MEPSTFEEAKRLVEEWAEVLGHPWSDMALQRITMTKLVKERMTREIAALINDVVHRGQYTAS